MQIGGGGTERVGAERGRSPLHALYNLTPLWTASHSIRGFMFYVRGWIRTHIRNWRISFAGQRTPENWFRHPAADYPDAHEEQSELNWSKWEHTKVCFQISAEHRHRKAQYNRSKLYIFAIIKQCMYSITTDIWLKSITSFLFVDQLSKHLLYSSLHRNKL